MSYYLLPHVNHHQQADLFSFHNYNKKLSIKTQIQKLPTFACEYLGFHTIYGLETLRTQFFSFSLLACKILA